MPVSFPAHQVAVLPLKKRWPDHFDGLALVVGAAAPDLHQAISSLVTTPSHTARGAVVFSIPFTIAYSLLLRRWAMPGVFRAFHGDTFGWIGRFGPIISGHRPTLLITVYSAVLGVVSHLIVDSFTHTNGHMSRLLGLDYTVIEGSVKTVTVANLLQYWGHTVSSLVGLAMLYGLSSQLHDRARSQGALPETAATTTRLRHVVWMVVLSVIIGALWAPSAYRTFSTSGFTLVVIITVYGLIIERRVRRSEEKPDRRDRELHQSITKAG